MKKPYTLIKASLIAIVALFIFSCSKKGNPKPAPASIIGKWNITADTSRIFDYAPYNIVGINSPYIQFNADGSGTEKNNISTPDVVLNFTYKISKDTIAFNYSPQIQLAAGNTPTGIIKELTAHNAIIEYDFSDPTLTFTEHIYLSR